MSITARDYSAAREKTEKWATKASARDATFYALKFTWDPIWASPCNTLRDSDVVDGPRASSKSRRQLSKIIIMSGLLSVCWHLNQRDLQISSLGVGQTLGGRDKSTWDPIWASPCNTLRDSDVVDGPRASSKSRRQLWTSGGQHFSGHLITGAAISTRPWGRRPHPSRATYLQVSLVQMPADAQQA
jgi:hypothetical protein